MCIHIICNRCWLFTGGMLAIHGLLGCFGIWFVAHLNSSIYVFIYTSYITKLSLLINQQLPSYCLHVSGWGSLPKTFTARNLASRAQFSRSLSSGNTLSSSIFSRAWLAKSTGEGALGTSGRAFKGSLLKAGLKGNQKDTTFCLVPIF